MKGFDLAQDGSATPPRRTQQLTLAFVALLAIAAPYTLLGTYLSPAQVPPAVSLQTRAEFDASLLRCSRLNLKPAPPADFAQRTTSDRFVPGTPAVLIRNATVWTGGDDGNELLLGHNVLMRGGLIVSVFADEDLAAMSAATTQVTIVRQAHGAWLTPGVVDIHSHIGVESVPGLEGAGDGNSIGRPINPFLRSLDSINTHDQAYMRSISGGVTTSLVLPGSANNIGGQAFAIKLRATAARTPDSMVLEMPYTVAGSPEWKEGEPPRWRHMKMACGENIRRVYGQTRMDLSNNFRDAFERAKALKLKQDDYCDAAQLAVKNGKVLTERFPDDLEWEALTDVLRGKVKVHTHCYEATDFAAFIRHTNEFEFPVAAFHHAHEAWLVPRLLKQTWGGAPAVAIFALFSRYKREAWRATEYAPAILERENITVIMKSDHPGLDSRHLMFEAQQAHHWGLSTNKALASVTSIPARTAGFGHRIGLVKEGYDADIALWDSHPLSLGAKPNQVYIDGIDQLAAPFESKPLSTDTVPPPTASMPEDPITLRDEDDPYTHAASPARAKAESYEAVVFINVNEVLLLNLESAWADQLERLEAPFDVHLRSGELVCVGSCVGSAGSDARVVDLQGGSLIPQIVAFDAGVGLVDINGDDSTIDGDVFDPLAEGDLSRTQQLYGPTESIEAVDGLAFGGKPMQISHAAGIAKAVTAPQGVGFFRGVSVAIRTGAEGVLEEGAVLKKAVALHVALSHQLEISIATQIGELRGLLLGRGGLARDARATRAKDYFAQAGRGEVPLVVNVARADQIASLILLKREVEAALEPSAPLNWIVSGGQEAHLVASQLATANISVILSARAYPDSWDSRRSLAGPPLTAQNAPTILHQAGVKIALTIPAGAVPPGWQVKQLMWEAAWAQKDSGGSVERRDAVEWVSSAIEEILGLPRAHEKVEFVAYERDPFEFGSRAVAVSSADATRVEMLKG